jgi:hypothetical protein
MPQGQKDSITTVFLVRHIVHQCEICWQFQLNHKEIGFMLLINKDDLCVSNMVLLLHLDLYC